MTFFRTASDAVVGYRDCVAAAIAGAVKELLETKHLYQSVSVQTEAVRKTFLPRIELSVREHVEGYLVDAQQLPWVVRDAEGLQSVIDTLAGAKQHQAVIWQSPDVKLYCKRCERLEPFNSSSASCVFNRSNPTFGGIRRDGNYIQAYVLSYLCQSCKCVPDVFLVYRLGAKLTLTGRAPMEHVEVPRSIPRDISKYISGAVVAHQSGQTLAALFLLRTACEQWVRGFGEPSDKADTAMEKYMNSLPDDFKARFPSVRDIYGELSAAIHLADASEALYQKTMSAIDQHFTARVIFKL